jgi:hypothetical protein
MVQLETRSILFGGYHWTFDCYTCLLKLCEHDIALTPPCNLSNGAQLLSDLREILFGTRGNVRGLHLIGGATRS